MKKCIKMYEKNANETGIEELDIFLRLIADLEREIEFFALGGTAMVVKGIKEATQDIDFLTTADYGQIKNLFTQAGLKEQSAGACNVWYLDNKRIDLFYGGFIMGVPLEDDWKELSEEIKTIGTVKLYILNWYDTIITKLARSERRDIEDIVSIIKAINLDFNKLKERYYRVAETALIADYKAKFKHLENVYDSGKIN